MRQRDIELRVLSARAGMERSAIRPAAQKKDDVSGDIGLRCGKDEVKNVSKKAPTLCSARRKEKSTQLRASATGQTRRGAEHLLERGALLGQNTVQGVGECRQPQAQHTKRPVFVVGVPAPLAEDLQSWLSILVRKTRPVPGSAASDRAAASKR